MNRLLYRLYPYLPVCIHNLFISWYNISAYRVRYGGRYREYREHLISERDLTLEQLKEIQYRRLIEFLKFSAAYSGYYRELYKDIDFNKFGSVDDLKQLPVVNKEMFRSNIHNIYTVSKKEGVVSKTGGTTGKSLEVLFTKQDFQERFAMMDNFRSQFGYELGKRTAWFSGKSLLTGRDVKKNRFWKTDYWYKVRYYSTFHIKEENLIFYINDLIKFRPEFIIGFPSNIAEIARYGLANKIDFPEGCIKAVFPTAETVTDNTRSVIEEFFKTRVYDQYASSEGAHFIFECIKNKLHLELRSGVYEVVDENDRPANKGRLLVTSFTTRGAPLIRFDIEDEIELSDEKCTCGNNNPLVKHILGRMDDYVYSPEVGKINLGNASNTLKDTKGIIKFQVIQDSLYELHIKMVIDKKDYNTKTERVFLSNWRDRVGNIMAIKLEFVDDIPVEKSGKFRMLKNNIKHLVEKT